MTAESQSRPRDNGYIFERFFAHFPAVSCFVRPFQKSNQTFFNLLCCPFATCTLGAVRKENADFNSESLRVCGL